MLESEQLQFKKQMGEAESRENPTNEIESEGPKIAFKNVVDLDKRTIDVKSDKDFQNLMLDKELLAKLAKNGIMKPSPVQAEAIPLSLLGFDLLVQAKTGTGKTLVFAILTANKLSETQSTHSSRPIVLIISPSREIAQQNCNTLKAFVPDTERIGLFLGGQCMSDSCEFIRKGCRVAIGSCGRITHLIESGKLNVQDVSLFVLDEADKLMEESFERNINFIFSKLPRTDLQTCVFSATYPNNMDKVLCEYMKEPTLIRLISNELQLIGITQYALFTPNQNPFYVLRHLLKNNPYSQCIIFSNNQIECTNISKDLSKHGIQANEYSSALLQEQRLKLLSDLQKMKIRSIVATDLAARGIDAPNIDFIINFECPNNVESYLHRMGRAGRFGRKGTVITILSNLEQYQKLQKFLVEHKLHIKSLEFKASSNILGNSEYFENAQEFNNNKCPETSHKSDLHSVLMDHQKELLYSSNSTLGSEDESSTKIAPPKQATDLLNVNVSIADPYAVNVTPPGHSPEQLEFPFKAKPKRVDQDVPLHNIDENSTSPILSPSAVNLTPPGNSPQKLEFPFKTVPSNGDLHVSTCNIDENPTNSGLLPSPNCSLPNIDITRRLLYSRDEFMKIGEKDSFNPQMIEGYNAEELPFGPGRKKPSNRNSNKLEPSNRNSNKLEGSFAARARRKVQEPLEEKKLESVEPKTDEFSDSSKVATTSKNVRPFEPFRQTTSVSSTNFPPPRHYGQPPVYASKKKVDKVVEPPSQLLDISKFTNIVNPSPTTAKNYIQYLRYYAQMRKDFLKKDEEIQTKALNNGLLKEKFVPNVVVNLNEVTESTKPQKAEKINGHTESIIQSSQPSHSKYWPFEPPIVVDINSWLQYLKEINDRIALLSSS